MRNINDVGYYEDDHGHLKNPITFDHSGKYSNDTVKPSNVYTITEQKIEDTANDSLYLILTLECNNNILLKNDIDAFLKKNGIERYNKEKEITFDQLKISYWTEEKVKKTYINGLKKIATKHKLF